MTEDIADTQTVTGKDFSLGVDIWIIYKTPASPTKTAFGDAARAAS
jgi:hypothetical protein